MASMEELCQSNYPEPEFLDEGRLGVDNNTYHLKAKVEGNIISVGDAVIFLTDQSKITFIGKIVSMFKNPENQLMAKVNWYQRREELGEDGQRDYVLAREILLTEQIDISPLDSILKKVTVYTDPTPLGDDVNKRSALVTDTFFCNRGYLVSRGEFIALSTLTRLMKSAECVVETVEGTTKFDMAKAMLQLNFVTSVAGRDREIDMVERKVESFIAQGGPGGCIYLSGVPGTGKTLVVRESMRRLAVKELAGDVPPFQFYELNCLRLETPRDIYSELWKVLTDDRLNPTAAQNALNDMFKNDVSPFYIVVLVDEIDVLLTPQQNELYCLMEWSSWNKAKFVVIAVANLMDLESRLKPKIASRMGHNTVKFNAYQSDQLDAIIRSRVGELHVFNDKAITLCSKIIANNGGDARKALESCKRALDLKNEEDLEITAPQMKMAINKISAIQASSLLANLSLYQQVFLTALLISMKKEGKLLMPLRSVLKRMSQLARKLKLIDLNAGAVVPIVNQLVNMNIIKGNKDGPVNASSSVSLIPFDQEVVSKLSENSELKEHLPVME